MTTERSFGDVYAYLTNGHWHFELHRTSGFSEQMLDDLADDIHAAQCWVRDQKRRADEDQTPELLPL